MDDCDWNDCKNPFNPSKTKILNPKNGGLVRMLFLFNWVILGSKCLFLQGDFFYFFNHFLNLKKTFFFHSACRGIHSSNMSLFEPFQNLVEVENSWCFPAVLTIFFMCCCWQILTICIKKGGM